MDAVRTQAYVALPIIPQYPSLLSAQEADIREPSSPVHESLAQCIVVRHPLTGLTHAELPECLMHRLRLPGCALALFEPPAVEGLF